MFASICLVTSGVAGAPLLVDNFRPWYSAGLWLAVMLMPPAALQWRMVCAITGVGVSRLHRSGLSPFTASTSAAASENSRPRNLVSYPNMTTLDFGLWTLDK